ncbi:patatin-domain-containing protein [Lophiostoma macrostomum CBS 122681]|uniref:Patatin-like phospholipase domain-containing protein n=1 Tax=Lophiostoma macrostomum CBS 122681 TaxID=1314788 RepID=A0A6A6T5S0_9PLEO|nr:patatin-domain-containing protein [Lophiostoma macrostomum CBS 122681]
MSFLSDTVVPGSSQLHIRGGAAAGKDGNKVPRESKSHTGLLTPLVHLIRNPGEALGGVASIVEHVTEEAAATVAQQERRQLLNLRLKNAESHEDWKSAAIELDVLEGNDVWKAEDDSPEYNAPLVAARLKQLDDARISCDVKRMLFLIRTSLTRSLGGMGDLRLYKHSYVGTKSLIERYIDSAQRTLAALLDVSEKQGEQCPIEPKALCDQLLLARQSFGRSALLLSGGGTFGMNHIGVVKSLWANRLLPRIISGASAGSIVCAVLCTKVDADIPAVLEDFCYGDLAVFEKEGEEEGVMRKAARFLKYGALFDISHLVNVMRDLLGDITFQESYNRTRRILNITVSSASLYELPRLLNFITAPNVMIWSAVCASCSVPFVFSAASLLAKDPRTGKEVPWNPMPNAGWIDGSVDNDLPMTRLAEIFNVNHFIVSQVNPHVVPFLAKEEEIINAEAQQASAFSAGPTWIHNMANLAKGEALHRLHVLSEMGIFPNYLSKARSVLNQRYSGDITIFPSISYAHFPKVLSNPTTEYMLQCMLTGERATWPKLSRVQNHLAIELAIDEAIGKIRTRVVFSPSQIDLRKNNLTRPLSQGNDQVPSIKLGGSLRKTTTRLMRDIVRPTSISPRRANRSRTRLSSTHASRPYLPTHSRRKHTRPLEPSVTLDAFSSSERPDNTSSEDEMSVDSDTSDILSSPSPPHSPGRPPTLWPSSRQLFLSSSQPSTPSCASARPNPLGDSFSNLRMTSGQPSSPERRYRRLFHPAATQPPSSRPEDTPSILQTESLPETQDMPAAIPHGDSNPELILRVPDSPSSDFDQTLDAPISPRGK